LMDIHCYDYNEEILHEFRAGCIKWNLANSVISSHIFFTDAFKSTIHIIMQ